MGGCNGLCERCQRDFFLGKSHTELINGAKAQAFRKIIELNRGFSQTREFFIQAVTALGDCCASCSALNHCRTFVAGTGTRGIAEFGIEPVAARLTDFCRNDFDGLSGLKLGIERHHHPVDFAPRQR